MWLLRAAILLALSIAVFSRQWTSRLQTLIKHPVMWALLAYCGWGLFSNQLSEAPQHAFWSTYERLEGGLGLIFSVLLSTLLYGALGGAGQQRSYLWVLCLAILGLSVAGLLTEATRIHGLLGNPVYLGSVAAMGVFIVGFWLSKSWPDSTTPWRFVYAVLAMAMVGVLWLALYKSGSRGATLGLLSGAMVAAFSAWKLLAKPTFYKWSASGLALLMAVLGALWLASVTLPLSGFAENSLEYRFLQIPTGEQNTLDRLANWSIALEVYQQRPLIGHGSEAYMREFNAHYQAGVLDSSGIWFDRAHNVYLDILVAHGAVGLALFMLLLGVSVYALVWRSVYTPLQQALWLGLLTCYAVKNSVGFDSPTSNLIWISYLVFVMLGDKPRCNAAANAAVSDNENGAYKDKGKLNAMRWAGNWAGRGLFRAGLLRLGWLRVGMFWASLCWAGLFWAGLYYWVVVPLQANHAALQAVYAASTAPHFATGGNAAAPLSKLNSQLNARLTAADRAYPPGKAEHLQALYQAMAANKPFAVAALELFQQRSALAMAQTANQRVQYSAAAMLARTGQIPRAIPLFEHLTQQAPQRTVFWASLHRLYHNNDEPSKAANALDKVKTLNLNYFNKHFLNVD